jgi:hypothetical protein
MKSIEELNLKELIDCCNRIIRLDNSPCPYEAEILSRFAEPEKENEELKTVLINTRNMSAETIDSMKCCGNCKHYYKNDKGFYECSQPYGFVRKGNCDKWESVMCLNAKSQGMSIS